MQVGDILAGKYRLVKRLGEGGEGSVFLAIHLQTEMFWAIKEIRIGQAPAGTREPEEAKEIPLPPDAGEAADARSKPVAKRNAEKRDSPDASVCHELQMMKRLKNRHLPQIIDVIMDQEYVWLVMEHVRGIPLDRKLKNGRVLSAMEVMDVAEQVADTLCYLEGRDPPVCHLDIKPSNLIRRPDGLIKLVDFGSAWKEKTQVKRMGTEGYAAPEQYQISGSLPDVRTDIYALGATLYRMSTGKKWSFAMRLSSVPNCTREMSDLIRRCLEADPADRFQDAVSLKAALARMRKKERHEKGRVRLLGSLAVALPAAALCLQILPSVLDLSADESWDYDKLIKEAGVVSVEESREYYKKAVFLEPCRSGVYLKYLSDVQIDGIFSEEEERFLRDILHTVRPGTGQTYEELLETVPDAYLETVYQIGLAYWYSCPREDRRRIALGWFEKAAAYAADDDHKPSSCPDELRQQAALYLEMGSVWEKLQTPDEEASGQGSVLYWQDIEQVLIQSRDGNGIKDPVMQLKFCREALNSLTFLAGDLVRGGIDGKEQTARIRELESYAKEIEIPAAQEVLGRQIIEDITHAAGAALEAIHNTVKEDVA